MKVAHNESMGAAAGPKGVYILLDVCHRITGGTSPRLQHQASAPAAAPLLSRMHG